VAMPNTSATPSLALVSVRINKVVRVEAESDFANDPRLSQLRRVS